ncbi:GTPase ObgE [Propionimicrobium lymphophilum]|uniref:GTPase ObgE n=1 Tax=Propionimicrobium lymphophilum TaxID=33012 RepID=UPI0023F0B369|nr:GTPase ObgE [Propionimicrobium lymphophilum]
MAIPSFVDRAVLKVAAGSGGNGCASVRREKFKPLGGPDGGNGGNGGSIILRVDPGLHTLVDYHRQSQRKAENGQPGMGNFRAGSNGEDIVLSVPIGTVVSEEGGGVLADLTEETPEYVVAKGGRGGLGNAALASKARKAPGFALLGEPGDELTIVLEMKVVADIGLVGFPSAGKSSLIAAISAAKPEIADYPFTTLVPNLGVVVADDVTYTVADVPGLIPGASEGKGLGHDFLRHIERCQALVHVIDCATYEPGRDPLSDFDAIELELNNYGGLEERPRLVALNKIDVPDGADMADIVIDSLTERGLKVFPISTKTGEGITELKFAMANLVEEMKRDQPKPVPIVIKPKPVDSRSDSTFTIKRQGDGEGGEIWRVRGERPERWVRQTDFSNDEAVGYLADRLNRLGIEDELLKMGAMPGDAVAIGPGKHPVVFDFSPQVESGAELLGHRGEDPRLDEVRPSVVRRRELDAEYKEKRAQSLSGVKREEGVDWREQHRRELEADMATDFED